MLLLIVDTFNKELSHNRPWEIFLEGNQSLAFNLNQTPTRSQIMGIYARCQFLPSYYMQTFEELFTTGFFDKGLAIFGPSVKNPTLRYVAYKEAEAGNPVQQAILQAEHNK